MTIARSSMRKLPKTPNSKTSIHNILLTTYQSSYNNTAPVLKKFAESKKPKKTATLGGRRTFMIFNY